MTAEMTDRFDAKYSWKTEYICPTTAVFPSAILTQRRTSICVFLDFPRNMSKKIIGLPKFAEQGNIVHCHRQHLSAHCISVRWITQLAKMEKEKRLSCLFFKWSSKKRSWTTLASKGKHKGQSSEGPRKKCRRKICQQYDGKHVIKKLHTGLQLKELGDKVQYYQTENQKCEHAIAPWRMWILMWLLRKLMLREIKVLEINAT